MDAQEVDLAQDVVGTEWTVPDLLRVGPHHDRVQGIGAPDGARDQPGPVDGHRIGRFARVPERRLVGEIPTLNRSLARVTASELRGKVGFQAQHLRIRVRMTPVAPGHVPNRFADLVADEQAGLQVDLIAARQFDQFIELGERRRVVVAWARLEPGPHEVQADGVHAQFAHLAEIGFHACRIPFHGPLHGGLGGHPMHARGDKRPAVALEVVAVQTDRGQGPLCRGPRRQQARQRARANRQQWKLSHRSISTPWS